MVDWVEMSDEFDEYDKNNLCVLMCVWGVRWGFVCINVEQVNMEGEGRRCGQFLSDNQN